MSDRPQFEFRRSSTRRRFKRARVAKSHAGKPDWFDGSCRSDWRRADRRTCSSASWGGVDGRTAHSVATVRAQGTTTLSPSPTPAGNIVGDNDGLFRDDARSLSLYKDARRRGSSLLSAQMSRDNVGFSSPTSPIGLPPLGGRSLEHGVIPRRAQATVACRRLYERISSRILRTGHHGATRIFVRGGFSRHVRGARHGAAGARQVADPRDSRTLRSVFSISGLDGVRSVICISFSEKPVSMSGRDASFVFKLGYNATVTLHVEIGPDEAIVDEQRFRAAEAQARWNMRRVRRRGATLRSRNHVFDDWLEQSRPIWRC